MQHHFYAYMARMKLIKRWGLRHNTREENDQEHSLQVAMIAHALAIYKNRRYGGNVDVEKVLLYALYHEAAEVITGDLASPIKYFNPGIRDAYKEIEHMPRKSCWTICPRIFRKISGNCSFPTRRVTNGASSRLPIASAPTSSVWRNTGLATANSSPRRRTSAPPSRR